MKILAIETSCDDTCIALLEIKKSKFNILRSVVSSQVKLHAKHGGVYPSLAKREHLKNLPLIFKKFEHKKIDFVAVTIGPGLEPCLWTGINFAKELSKKFNAPIIPVNHIEGHILANFIGKDSKSLLCQQKEKIPALSTEKQNTKFIFPAVCLVVSGGHTQLILMEKIGKYKIIGETRDDAAGECFDKTARILGLGYPGGPALAKEAAKFEAQNSKFEIKLPRPMIDQKSYDFSFSGLKTAVLYEYQKRPIKTRENRKYIQEISHEVQQAIIDVLVRKTVLAAKDYKAKSIILGGGVVANQELRKQIRRAIVKNLPNTKYIMPNIKYCTDNAVMIAITGYSKLMRMERKKIQKIKRAKANLRINGQK